MPTYRKLHTKTLDSTDFNDMPDDFTRVMWLLLPLRCDRDGRAIDDPQWIRSALFPRRRDVTIEAIESAMAWLADRGMIVRYKSGNEACFHIPSWGKHQTGTDREAPSALPPPPCNGQELVVSLSVVDQAKEIHAVPVPDTVFVPVLEGVKSGEEIVKQKDHPALVVWRETHEGKYPVKAMWPDVIQAIGTDNSALARWRATIKAYIACGWNPNNLGAMLEFYSRNEMPRATPKNGHTYQQPPQAPRRVLRGPNDD